MSASFVHLKCHTEYSIVNGLIRVPELVGFAKTHGMMAIAVTDVCNVFALVKFYKQAWKQGIKPIIGAELRIRDAQGFFTVTVLCQNNQGYKHLTELLTQAYLKGQGASDLPEVKREWLEEKNAGLIILSGGRCGDVGQALLRKDHDQAKCLLQRWQQFFPDRYYIELVRTYRDTERDYLHAALALAQACDVAVVATNDVMFPTEEDFDAHEARVCIHSGRLLDDSERPRHYSKAQYLKSPEQMAELFSDIPEALANTVAIAQRCNVRITLNETFLPQFPLPEGVSLEAHIRDSVEQQLSRYWPSIADHSGHSQADYQQRLDIELDVINRMGFPGYFLIVADFIRWAKDNDIPVGPGRGSGAGSLVAYFLGITMLDPLEHGLLFERFLNPERVSMPDFDIDFCMDRRDEVIDYVADKYGHDAVSQIITYGTMAAKAVVRDVGRVMGYPYGMVDTIAKMVPFELGITLDKALAQEDDLRERYETEEEVTLLLDLARRLEGVVRNAGKHAGGVVIAPATLTDFCPLYCEEGGEHPVSQFDKDDVEAVGLVKFDFLGLRTLTIIHWAITAINQRRNKNNESLINIDTIPLDDKKTFDLLKSCATTAVFQLESRGMKELMRRLQPDSFDEITALVALFRPGPLQSGMVDDFIDRKHGRAPVEYSHPDLADILSSTYGVILYQEQVMKIAQVLANYTLGGADILRRAMGKKKPEEMAKQRQIFCDGAEARAIDSKVAEHVFDLMEKFAGYGFNKSHSAAYALIAYQTAYLKAHFPAEFMAAVLSSDMDNTDKVVGFLEEASAMGLKVLSPQINQGEYYFKVNPAGEIVYGLGAIKGFGHAACDSVVQAREQGGDFRNLFNFCDRVDMHKVSRRGLEPLICSGCFDVFEQSRASLMTTVNKAIAAAEQNRRNAERGQADMFADLSSTDNDVLEYVIVKDWPLAQTLQAEKDSLGYYLSGHPFNLYQQECEPFIKAPLGSLRSYVGKAITVGGILIAQRVVFTKKGRRMAILTLEDHSGKCEVTLFSRLYDKVKELLISDSVLIIKGKIEHDDYSGRERMLAEELSTLSEKRCSRLRCVMLRMDKKEQADSLLVQLPLILQPFRGGRVVIKVHYRGDDARAELQLGQTWQVRPEDELLKQLRHCCGADNVLLQYR